MERKGKLAAAAAGIAGALALLLFILSRAGGGTAMGAGAVYITELMCANDCCPAPDGSFCDWVELMNAGEAAFDLGGCGLTDDRNSLRFVFPEGTRLEPGERLVVWCGAGREGGLNAPFGLARGGGEELRLVNRQRAVLDSLVTVEAGAGCSLTRTAAGALESCAAPTPGYPNDAAGRAAYVAAMTLEASPLRITELMARNDATLADASGGFPDWVELTNVSGEAVSLEGWYLFDDAARPYAWRLPAVTLEAGARLVVYASGRDGGAAGEVHAPFALAAGGGTLVLHDALGRLADSVCWPALEADRAWAVTDGAWGETLAATPGYDNSEAGYEACMRDTRPAPALAINEVVTANDSTLPRGGVYYDWVELANNGDAPLALEGWRLTDDADEPDRCVLPAVTLAPGERFLVFCSGDAALGSAAEPHAPFALNAAEDRLYLFSPEGELADFALLTGIPRGGSLGRLPGEGGFFLFETPSPGAENAGGRRFASAAPEALTAQGVYDGVDGLAVALEAAGEIYYSTDGSVPGADSARYDGPIALTETTVLRAVACEPGKLPSAVATFSYILNEGHTMPVVSLVTDPANLWDPETGIYVAGNHTNYNQDWERDASLSLFEPGGGGFTAEAGLKLHGATSRFVTGKKTFKLLFRARYGQKTLDYDVFGDGEVTRFGSLLLRAGVDDIYPSLIKDDLYALLAKEGSDSLLSMNSRYCVLYLNGAYWGVYAIREAMSEEYYAAYHDVAPESVTMIDSSGTYGTGFGELLAFIETHSLADPENYAWVEARLDVENLIDWCILEAYSANGDIWNNLRYYGSSQGDGKWRYALVDLDLTMFSPGYGFADTSLQGVHGRLPRALLANADFRALFMERAGALLSGVLSDAHVAAKVEALAAALRPEIARDRERWGGSLESWERFVQRILDFTRDGRAAFLARDCAQLLHMSAEELETCFGEVLA